MSTAMENSMRINLRKRRAEALVHAALQKLDPLLSDEPRTREMAYRALVELFVAEGVEILTDFDRQEMGLSPRGQEGWTVEEIIALEQHRLAALTRPLTFTLKGPVQVEP